MSESMVERVAQAAYAQMLANVDVSPLRNLHVAWTAVPDDVRRHWREIAHAAIAAMRDLTEADMIPAGACLVEVTEAGKFGPTASFSAPVGVWWRAIIDAALAEKP